MKVALGAVIVVAGFLAVSAAAGFVRQHLTAVRDVCAVVLVLAAYALVALVIRSGHEHRWVSRARPDDWFAKYRIEADPEPVPPAVIPPGPAEPAGRHLHVVRDTPEAVK